MTSIEEKIDDIIEQLEDLKLEIKEQWTEIEADPDYDISTLGRVRKRGNGFEPKLTFDKNNGYYLVKLARKPYKLHRLLAQAFIPNPENKPCVDHIDGNKQNNHLSNLRWATYSENCRNRGKQRNNTSGHTGASFHKASGKWQAQITGKDGKKKHLGLFHTKEEAAAVYEEAARKEFGEFFCER